MQKLEGFVWKRGSFALQEPFLLLITTKRNCWHITIEPGFWKFNTALLKDEAYVTALKINIPIFKEKYNEVHDLGLKWFHDQVL